MKRIIFIDSVISKDNLLLVNWSRCLFISENIRKNCRKLLYNIKIF